MLRKSARLEARQIKLVAGAAILSMRNNLQAENSTANCQYQDSDPENPVAIKPQRKKRQVMEKRIHSNNQASATKNDNALDDTAEHPPKKKIKKSSPPSTVTSSLEPGPAPSIVVTVNKSDPCAVLPTELWHRILDFLPLAKAAQTSLVSKSWLHGTRSSPIWMAICKKCGLGKPKKKFKSYMALACAHSYWICEGCFSVTKGRQRGSHIPLPVSLSAQTLATGSDSASFVRAKVDSVCVYNLRSGSRRSGGRRPSQFELIKYIYNQDVSIKQKGGNKATQEVCEVNDQRSQATDSNSLMLCFACRRNHFGNHPEAPRPGTFGIEQDLEILTRRVAKSTAFSIYGLNGDDIRGLSYETRRSPYRLNGWPMRMYNRNEIQDLALEIHAGWVGIDAVRNGVSCTRRKRFKERIRENGCVAVPRQSQK
ncbi:hypothetical protein EC991_004990 [Linnemannia zychae]|nr:hypothetical protein EC991_004990 [Linnemannia zychae]